MGKKIDENWLIINTRCYVPDRISGQQGYRVDGKTEKLGIGDSDGLVQIDPQRYFLSRAITNYEEKEREEKSLLHFVAIDINRMLTFHFKKCGKSVGARVGTTCRGNVFIRTEQHDRSKK